MPDTAIQSQPILHTQRLFLRPFTMEDAPMVHRYAGERELASGVGNAWLHPYPVGAAETWVMMHDDFWDKQQEAIWAITVREERSATDSGSSSVGGAESQSQDGLLVGSIGLILAPDHTRAELGYWVGVPHWGVGYASEAAQEVVRFAFEEFEQFGSFRIEKISAQHYARNPASGRVLQKVGMQHEGTLRQHFRKWGVLEDLEQYGVLRGEWEANKL